MSLDLKPNNAFPVSLLAASFFSSPEQFVEVAKPWLNIINSFRELPLSESLMEALKGHFDSQQEEKARKEYEIKAYGRILPPLERNKAKRNEALDREEEYLNELKLQALRVEQAEARQRTAQLLERVKQSPSSTGHAGKLKRCHLEPGEIRALKALKSAYPKALTVKELCPLTKKDELSEETPRGSLYVWLKRLQVLGLVQDNSLRPKRWIFVKEYES